MAKKLLSLVIVVLLCFSLLAGCTSSGTSGPDEGSAAGQSISSSGSGTGSGSGQAGTSSDNQLAEGKFTGYPMITDETLSIWTGHYPIDASFSNESESPLHIGFSKNTGVKIKWIRPAAGANADQSFNLMLASNDLPDIIINEKINISATTLIPDGYIITLNDYIEDYAPALLAYLNKNPEFLKAVKSDTKDFYAFPWLRSTDYLRTWMGPCLRQDLLDKVGLDIPITIADWEEYFYAVKDLVKIPLGSRGATTVCDFTKNAYGIELGYYLDGDRVKYGYAEPGFRELMILTNKWYKDGLIDPDYATVNANGMQTKILNGQIGSCYSAAAALPTYVKGLQESGSDNVWTSAPYPVLNKGDEIKIIHGENYWRGMGAVITTACKNVELACRFLDYGYTDEGAIYMNFGTEGVSFEYVNGVPTFTDKIMKAPEGMLSALYKYVATSQNAITYHIQGMYEQRCGEIGNKAINVWTEGVNVQKAKMPAITPTTAENTATSSIENAISTYASEMYNKFIMGEEDISNFQKFVDNLNSMGLQNVLDIKTSQVKRYNNR